MFHCIFIQRFVFILSQYLFLFIHCFLPTAGFDQGFHCEVTVMLTCTHLPRGLVWWEDYNNRQTSACPPHFDLKSKPTLPLNDSHSDYKVPCKTAAYKISVKLFKTTQFFLQLHTVNFLISTKNKVWNVDYSFQKEIILDFQNADWSRRKSKNL